MIFMSIFFLSFLLTLLLVKLIYPLALSVDLVDNPGKRKYHVGAVPLIGGVSIFISLLLSFWALDISFVEHAPLLISLSIIVFIGVLDDFFQLSYKVRFLFQVLIAYIMVYYAGVELSNIGDLLSFGALELGGFGFIFTTFAVIGCINAFNMMDGIDGLSASLAIIALLGFFFIPNEGEPLALYQLMVLLVGSLSAFLYFNLCAKNKIFLGDAGSMLIGLVVAWFAIYFSQEGVNKTIQPVTALWLVAIPLMDTVSIMIRRIMKGESPFKPDREHLHHIFLRAGYSDRQALVIIVCTSIILAGIGILFNIFTVPEWIVFSSFLVIFGAYFQLLHHSWVFMKWLKIIHKPSDNSSKK